MGKLIELLGWRTVSRITLRNGTRIYRVQRWWKVKILVEVDGSVYEL